ncbi:hypothetical protein [Tautonia plasticadhaerens]|uniref:Uncharacterized protein n=1 Tax=Tautonia plasticadhaerens TaxID=2527974 RepID=A0A518HFQ9_9BACT|nr:hypothetical protein [Tautonia plasticadhaerens]QDV39675.1 hypothetical protein ElP_76470 [Tautonia plasticadhaerens]
MTNPNPMAKLWPLGAFLAAVGYCVRPYVMPEPPPMPPTPQLPKIDASWLKPTFEPPVDRNPFLPPGADPPPPTIAGTPDAAPGAAGSASGLDGDGDGGPATAAAKAGPPDGPPAPFTLGATMVSGPRRAAIIDGRVYRQGERIEVGGARWTVDRIEPGRVLLDRPGLPGPLVVEMSGRAPRPADAPADAPGDGPATGIAGRIGHGLDDARQVLAAAGVHLPGPSLLEEVAARSGGTVPGAYRSLLDLLVSPPGAPGRSSAAIDAGLGGGEGR